MLKRYHIIFLLFILGCVSCIRDPKQPGRAYMPDMQYSTAYDAGSPNPIFKDGKTDELAPPGSVGVGKYLYPLADSEYEKAATAITNPFTFTKEQIEGEGKHLFLMNCAICHGEKGDGQGHLVQIQKFPPPPSYLIEPLLSKPEGQRYHTLMYGKNMMGSYASQLDHRERWLVLSYVKSLQMAAVAQSKPATAAKTDSTKTK
ncbi:MAG: quinol:cytochrome c oxidoreductase monoheme cytochrome subunit [Bacteroidota bacterium]|nr:quinol:cytochrome c oxidoreductase monoheme cytochrome subunit [Bacteroidota bacterium]